MDAQGVNGGQGATVPAPAPAADPLQMLREVLELQRKSDPDLDVDETLASLLSKLAR